jgi:TolB-like protein
MRVARLHRVVVLPFAIPEGAPRSLSDGFADEITSDLAGAGFAVVDRESVDETGTDAVLVGRVVTYSDQSVSPEVDTSLAVSVQLIDVRTKEVLLSTSSNATAAGTFCSQEMTCLRGKVLAAIGRFIVGGGRSP